MDVIDPGLEVSSLLPSRIIPAIMAWIESCNSAMSKLEEKERNTAESMMYFLVQRVNPENKWFKDGERATINQVMPSLSEVERLLMMRTSGRLRLVFYPFGGKSQEVGAQIIRSLPFDWLYAPPDGEPEDAATSVRMGAAQENTLAVTMMLRAEAERRRMMLDVNADLASERRLNRAREDALVDRVIKTSNDTLELARRILAVSTRQIGDAHEMRMRAMGVETEAHVAGRRARLMMADAEAMLEDAENMLEEGQTEPWERVISTLLANEEGRKFLASSADRVLDMIGNIISPSSTKAIDDDLRAKLRRIGRTDILAMMGELELTEAQMQKAAALLTKTK